MLEPICHGHLWKRLLRNAAKLKTAINNSVHSWRQEKCKGITKLFPITLFYAFCCTKTVFLTFLLSIAHSTSCSLIQLLKSHSREIWESMALQGNATGGSSSLMEMNAVDQWQLRLLCTTIGRLGVLICIITDHLRDTVKTFHRAGLLWSYG